MKNTEISALLKNISDSFLALSKIFSSTEEIDSAKQPKASVLEETGIEYCAKENWDADFCSAKRKNSQCHCGIYFGRTAKVRRCPCFSAGIPTVYGNKKHQPLGLYDR